MLTNPTFIDFTNAAKSLRIEPPPQAIKLQEGIYISSFPHNYNHTITNKHNNNPPLYEYYPWSSRPSYGVCDNHQQILKEYPELEADKKRHYTTKRRLEMAQMGTIHRHTRIKSRIPL